MHPISALSGPLIPLAIGLLANLVADAILATRYRGSFALDTPLRNLKRWLRWGISLFGLWAAHMLCGPRSIAQLALLGLLTITAATDFEHLRLPPSWFMYAATVAGVFVATQSLGVEGFVQSVGTQAIWFALMTLTVMLLRRTAGGDIKVMMQYGALCGTVANSLIGMLAASAVMIPISLVYALIHRRSIGRTPLAPLAWGSPSCSCGGHSATNTTAATTLPHSLDLTWQQKASTVLQTHYKQHTLLLYCFKLNNHVFIWANH